MSNSKKLLIIMFIFVGMIIFTVSGLELINATNMIKTTSKEIERLYETGVCFFGFVFYFIGLKIWAKAEPFEQWLEAYRRASSNNPLEKTA